MKKEKRKNTAGTGGKLSEAGKGADKRLRLGLCELAKPEQSIIIFPVAVSDGKNEGNCSDVFDL